MKSPFKLPPDMKSKETNVMNHRLILMVIFIICFFSNSATLEAQDQNIQKSDPTDISHLLELSLENLMNIPITIASKKAQRIADAPSIVNLITREEMRKYEWNSINDILYKQAGFSPSYDVFQPGVSSRGIV